MVFVLLGVFEIRAFRKLSGRIILKINLLVVIVKSKPIYLWLVCLALWWSGVRNK